MPGTRPGRRSGTEPASGSRHYGLNRPNERLVFNRYPDSCRPAVPLRGRLWEHLRPIVAWAVISSRWGHAQSPARAAGPKAARPGGADRVHLPFHRPAALKFLEVYFIVHRQWIAAGITSCWQNCLAWRNVLHLRRHEAKAVGRCRGLPGHNDADVARPRRTLWSTRSGAHQAHAVRPMVLAAHPAARDASFAASPQSDARAYAHPRNTRRFFLVFGHDLVRKPVSTCRSHALF